MTSAILNVNHGWPIRRRDRSKLSLSGRSSAQINGALVVPPGDRLADRDAWDAQPSSPASSSG